MPSNTTCSTCGKAISWRSKRRKYCSQACQQKRDNNSSYAYAQQRGKLRKLQAINLLGGKCAKCGYDRNFAALGFHHRDESQKIMQLDLRTLGNTRWDLIEAELAKCDLLCSNCHAELHHPDCVF